MGEEHRQEVLNVKLADLLSQGRVVEDLFASRVGWE